MKTKISIKHYKVKFTVTLSQDASLNEVLNEYLNLLLATGYYSKDVEEIRGILDDYFDNKHKK